MSAWDVSDYELGCALGAAVGVDAWRGDPADIERIGAVMRPALEGMAEVTTSLVEAINALPVKVITECLSGDDQ